MVWILVVLLAGVAGFLAYLLLKQRKDVAVAAKDDPVAIPVAVPATPRQAPSKNKYWGKQFVVMEPEKACPQARELHGHCFAYGKVPPVPLAGCSHADCSCHFSDIEDRRSGLERRGGHERREQVRFEDRHDRRTGKDRRNNDGHYDWRYNP